MKYRKAKLILPECRVIDAKRAERQQIKTPASHLWWNVYYLQGFKNKPN